jgi:hypothetical protein
MIAGVIIHAAFFGFLTGWLAARKGHPTTSWFVLGTLLGAIATLLLHLQPDRRLDASAAPRR